MDNKEKRSDSDRKKVYFYFIILISVLIGSVSKISETYMKKDSQYLFEYNKKRQSITKYSNSDQKDKNILSLLRSLETDGVSTYLMFDVDQTLVRHDEVNMAMETYRSIMETMKADNESGGYIKEIPHNTGLFLNLSMPGVFYKVHDDTFLILDKERRVMRSFKGMRLVEEKCARGEQLEKGFYMDKNNYIILETPISIGVAMAITTFVDIYVDHERNVRESTEAEKVLISDAVKIVRGRINKMFDDWDNSILYKRIRDDPGKYIKSERRVSNTDMDGFFKLVNAASKTAVVSNAQKDFIKFEMEYVYGKGIMTCFDKVISRASKPKWFKSEQFVDMAEGSEVFYVGDSLFSDICGGRSSSQNITVIGIFDYIPDREPRKTPYHKYDNDTIWTLGEDEERLLSYANNFLVIEKLDNSDWVCIEDDWVMNINSIIMK